MKKVLTILFVFIAFVASAQSTFNRWFPTSGTDTYTTNITSYSAYANTVVYLKFGNTNTGAATININSIGAANIRYWDGNSWEPLPASHIDVNTVYKLSYNGSYFEMEAFGTGTGGSGTTMNNLPVEYKVTNYSLVPGDTSKMLVLQSPFNTLTLGSFASGVDGSQFVIYNETGATVTINPSTYVTKGPLEILDTTYAYIHFNADTFRISTATASAGTPGGSDTYVQFNDGGAFNGEAEFTYNKTDNVVKIHKLAGDATDGLIIEASNGTDIGILGAGNTANATWYGSHNFDAATASTIASFGASKTLSSLSTATYPSLTELAYVKGVTSAIQTQIDSKQATGLSWLLASGGTLTGVNTITSNTANQHIFTGTWTASANNQYHVGFAGSVTGRATANDRFSYFDISPSLTFGTYASGNTTGAIFNLTPTFTSTGVTGSGTATSIGFRYAPSGVTAQSHCAILVETGKVAIGTSTAPTASSHTLEVTSPSGTNMMRLIGSSKTISFFGNGTITSGAEGPGTGTVASGTITGLTYTVNNTGFTSGSNTSTAYSVLGTINNTGTYSGSHIGFYYGPTLTANTGSTLAFNNTVGSVLIGHTALAASTTRLQVRGIGTTTGQLALLEDNGGTSRLEVLDNGRTTVNGRLRQTQGADVASAAGAIALGGDGNSFEITGTSAITLISNTNWQNGSIVTLLFTSTATLTDGTANSGTDIGMELAGNANFVATADDVLTLVLSEIGGTQRWREVSRSVN